MFNVWQFTDAVEKFLNLSIGDSLTSKNPLIQLLAIVDRRVGIRTLKKIMNSISEQPMWLQYFYKLRLQAEEVV
ncbi:SF0329 family protein [Clostridium tetani]|uniref:SF0329 family protein n=1 Tax=Clostridium tetani TaxID=1513 RepID=UPI003BB95758